jgi:hypothetical protein
VIGNRHNVTVRASGHDHHVVAQRRFTGNVDRDDIFCLRVLEACEDQVKGTVGGIVAAARAPGENADDVSLCVRCCQVRSFP